MTKGIKSAKEEFGKETAADETKAVLKYLEAVDKVKHSTDEQEAARLIEEHSLAWEHVPTTLLKSKEVGLKFHVKRLMFKRREMFKFKRQSISFLAEIAFSTNSKYIRLNNVVYVNYFLIIVAFLQNASLSLCLLVCVCV